MSGVALKACPFCGAEPTVDSCDRLIVIKCDPCGYRRSFPGIVQTAESAAPIPKPEGSILEFYHQHAHEEAVANWNARALDRDAPGEQAVVDDGPPCNPHPDAPHGFNRNASHNADRYVCDCEGWAPDATTDQAFLRQEQAMTPEPNRPDERDAARDPDTTPDWTKKCEVCGETPIVPFTGMCGPCTFGEADTIGGNW